MNNLPTVNSPPIGLLAIIDRAATDPNFDIDKFERLLDARRDDEQNTGARLFNEALSRAQRKMTTISANANNPQTRSTYATYARLDGAIREHYTSEGFSVSYNTEPAGEPNVQRVVGMLSLGIISHRHQVDVPIDSAGLKGNQMMTRTHAAMSAFSYGKRLLLIAMFNLAIGDDDDGNAAGGRVQRPAPQPGPNPNQSNMIARAPIEITDADSGEIITADVNTTKVNPCKIAFDQKDDWRSWGEKIMWGVRRSTTIEEIDQWAVLNHDHLVKLEEVKPVIFKTLMTAIGAEKDRILAA